MMMVIHLMMLAKIRMPNSEDDDDDGGGDGGGGGDLLCSLMLPSFSFVFCIREYINQC